METLRALLKTRTTELEVLRSESAAAEARNTEESRSRTEQHKLEMEKKNSELAALTEKTQRDIARLKQSVEAVSSGRGRLEQLAELQTRLDEREAEWAEEKSQLEGQLANLAAENEALAESNQSLISALESGGSGAGGGGGEGAFSDLERRALEERNRDLETDLGNKIATLDKQQQVITLLKEKWEAGTRDAAAKQERIVLLEDRLRTAKKEYELLKSALESTKSASLALEEEYRAKEAETAAKLGEAHKKIAELNEKVEGLELQLSAAELEKIEAEKYRAASASEKEETAAEMGSIRERLNEAIQDRWLTEAKMQKLQKDFEAKVFCFFLFLVFFNAL